MPDINDITAEVTTIARDAAYVAVGLGVLGLQKAQVKRVDLQDKLNGDLHLDDRLAEAKAAVTCGVARLDDIVEETMQIVETALEPLEEQLPPAARDLTTKARRQARQVHSQIRQRIAAKS